METNYQELEKFAQDAVKEFTCQNIKTDTLVESVDSLNSTNSKFKEIHQYISDF